MARMMGPIKPAQMHNILLKSGAKRVGDEAVNKAVVAVGNKVIEIVEHASMITTEKANITLKDGDVAIAIAKACNAMGIQKGTLSKSKKGMIQIGAVDSFVRENKKTKRVSEKAIEMIADFALSYANSIAERAGKIVMSSRPKRITIQGGDIDLAIKL